jgi:hypothetical protein
VAKHVVRHRFRFDVVSAREGTAEYEKSLNFFQRVRDRSDLRKGVLKVNL